MGALMLRLPEIKKITSLSRSQIYKLISQQNFPQQVKLGSRSSAWVSSEIDQWLNDRIAERDGAEA